MIQNESTDSTIEFQQIWSHKQVSNSVNDEAALECVAHLNQKNYRKCLEVGLTTNLIKL